MRWALGAHWKMGRGRVGDWLVHVVPGAVVLDNGVGSAVPVAQSRVWRGKDFEP